MVIYIFYIHSFIYLSFSGDFGTARGMDTQMIMTHVGTRCVFLIFLIYILLYLWMSGFIAPEILAGNKFCFLFNYTFVIFIL
jgi:hypothetical protein